MLLDRTIRVYAVFSSLLKAGNETNLTDVVPNETCNDRKQQQ